MKTFCHHSVDQKPNQSARNVMLSTSELKQYTMKNPPQHMLGRSPEIERKYTEFASRREGRGNFIDSIKCTLRTKPYHFVPNDFPYHTTSNIEHWVCWYGKDITPAEIIRRLREKNKIVTFWKNYSHNMSIKEVSHIHVFIEK